MAGTASVYKFSVSNQNFDWFCARFNKATACGYLFPTSNSDFWGLKKKEEKQMWLFKTIVQKMIFLYY
nr:hypothetical protein [uncultured Draconibacterium sp.]